MDLPFFFVENLYTGLITLDEDTSKHMSVLRLQKGAGIALTNGKGQKAIATIVDDHRKKMVVEVASINGVQPSKSRVAIGISLIKNAARFEWFLEKATEIGVSEIIPLLCERTEKEKFRLGRLQQIVTSALLQSQQCWMPVLHQPMLFKNALKLSYEKKFIAHCLEGEKQNLSAVPASSSAMILIGPEGDFTPGEIEAALTGSFHPVALGNTRLRTETAGVVAATLLCIG